MKRVLKAPKKKQFIRDMCSIEVCRTDPLIRVYPYLLDFFRRRHPLERSDFVVAANMAYGWMPKMLTLKGTDEDWDIALDVLNRARSQRIIEQNDLRILRSCINESLVGASKILHFMNPQHHAIWDSKVYIYLTYKKPTYGNYGTINNLDLFCQYHRICDEVAAWPGFQDGLVYVSTKMGYDISAMRAIDYVMWSTARLCSAGSR